MQPREGLCYPDEKQRQRKSVLRQETVVQRLKEPDSLRVHILSL